MNSIRRQLTVGLAKGLLLLSIVCGAVLYLGVRSALTRQFDEALLGKARAFAALSNQMNDDADGREIALAALSDAVLAAIQVEAGDAAIVEIEEVINESHVYYKVECVRDGVVSEFLVTASGEFVRPLDEYGFAIHDAAMPEFQTSEGPEYYQVWEEDGEVIAKSPSLHNTSLTWPRQLTGDLLFIDTALPDRLRGRMVLLRFNPRPSDAGDSTQDSEPLVLAMARSRHDLDRALRVLASGMLVAGVLLIGGATIVVRRSITGGLASLDELAQQAAAIDAGSLHRRFPAAQLPDELTPIATRLNELLIRLEAAFDREKRFTADVAHELRTPIAELRALAEVGLRAGRLHDSNQELEPNLDDVLAIAIQMERLVTALLTLTRCESGQQEVICERLNLAAVVEDAWGHVAAKAAARAMRVTFELPGEAVVQTDRVILAAIVSNLLSNAVDYAPRGGMVTIEIETGESSPVLRISNTTDSLDPMDLQHLVEPFWQKDSARSDGAHSGIGLAIVAGFVKLLELELTFTLPSSNRLTATLSGLRVP